MFFYRIGFACCQQGDRSLCYRCTRYSLLLFLPGLLAACSLQVSPSAQKHTSIQNQSAVQDQATDPSSYTQKLNSAGFESKKSPESAKVTNSSSDISLFKSAVDQPLSPENTGELLDEVGSNWFYGQGLGETAVTVGTVAVFPPYALWVLGNAALQLSGEEPLEVSNILPEEEGQVWRSTYDGITSVPGRTTAVVAGEEFRTKEVARERIKAVLEKNSKENKQKSKEKVGQ